MVDAVCERDVCVCDSNRGDEVNDASSTAGTVRCTSAYCRCSGRVVVLDDDARWLFMSVMMSWQ